MKNIAPTGDNDEKDFIIWNDYISEAIKSQSRQIVLALKNDNVIGFFQYFVTDDTFVMEEIQISAEFQGTNNIFRDLISFALKNINNVLYVEAYANKNNKKSIVVLEKLGLEIAGENQKGTSFHFKGKYVDLLNWKN